MIRTVFTSRYQRPLVNYYSTAASSQPSSPENGNSAGDSDINDLMAHMLKRSAAKRQKRTEALSEIEQLNNSSEDVKTRIQAARIYWRKKFRIGDTYTPEDLIEQSANSQQRQSGLSSLFSSLSGARQDRKGKDDLFVDCNIKPQQMYKNAALLSEYVNDIGQVLPRRRTGLTKTSQIDLVKTLNRAVCFGIIPRAKKHPAMLNVRSKFTVSTNNK